MNRRDFVWGVATASYPNLPPHFAAISRAIDAGVDVRGCSSNTWPGAKAEPVVRSLPHWQICGPRAHFMTSRQQETTP